MQFDKLVQRLLKETREAPDGHYYTKKGNLRKGNPESDGRGGPKYASDPTDRKNYGPRENEEGDAETHKLLRMAEDILGNLEDSGYRELAARGISGVDDDYDDDAIDMLYNLIDQGWTRGSNAFRLARRIVDFGRRGLEEGEERPKEEDAEKVDKDRMKCNSPRRTSGGSKKFVVKACKDGKEKIVRFGDPNMKIKKSNPKRRKSFRARHKCDQKKDKFSAGYWSCKKW